MAYQITREYSNGYRCSCCQQTWEESEWIEDYESALSQIPGEAKISGDLELFEVSVIDGSTGEKIAWAQLRTSVGYGKYSGYDASAWSGYHPEKGSFEVVYEGSTRSSKTWKEVTDGLAARQKERDRAKAERDLADATARLAQLSKP